MPELEDCVAALATDQERDPDHAGDTELTALIASVGQTCQELRQGVQQLKRITLPERVRWEGAFTWHGNPRPYAEAFMRYYHCLEGLEAALERERDAVRTGTARGRKNSKHARPAALPTRSCMTPRPQSVPVCDTDDIAFRASFSCLASSESASVALPLVGFSCDIHQARHQSWTVSGNAMCPGALQAGARSVSIG